MSEEAPPAVEVDYEAGAGETPADYPSLQDKLEQAIAVTEKALTEYDSPAIMWTGGKDSTLTLYVVQEVARDLGVEVPPAIFIDHYQHFEAIHDFVERWGAAFELEVIYARNEDVGAYVEANDLAPGDDIPVDALNEHNQHHVRDLLEYEEETFPFLLDTYVGNHLLKTVALNDALREHDVDGVISGVRWDEQEARADETFFSSRHDPDTYPPHDRIHPILQFTERDVWDAFFEYVVPETVEGYPAGHVPKSTDDLPEGLSPDDLPISPKYWEGFRSLGSEVSTDKSAEEPAWMQDIENTTERAGRAQDKEDLMERLRDLGYM